MIHKTFKIDLESLLLIKLGVSWCFWEVGVNIDSLWIEYRF